MKRSQIRQILHSLIRGFLFGLVLSLGIIVTLLAGETPGLALADLSNASIQTMTVDPQGRKLYAVLDESLQSAAIYRSDDQGRTWQFVDSTPERSINALAVHPANASVMFVGTPGGPVETSNNLWRSDDGGQTWRKFFLTLPAQPDGLIPAVTALKVDPNQPEFLYVGTAGQGIYRFDVGTEGQGYTLIGNMADNERQDLYVTDIVAVPGGDVYVITTEGLLAVRGDNLDEIETLPDTAVSLAIDPARPQTLYAGTVGYGAYHSTDGGQSWQAINTGLGWRPGIILRVSAMAINKNNPDHLALATAYGVGDHLAGVGVYETPNGGKHWTKVANIEGVVTQLSIEEKEIYAVTADGLSSYGKNSQASSGLMPWLQFNTLLDLTAIQVVTLAITIALAGLVLVGRTDWIAKKHGVIDGFWVHPK